MIPAEKRWFSMDLKIWPGGTIPFITRAVSEENAKLQAQNFLFLHRWKGRVGEPKCLPKFSPTRLRAAFKFTLEDE